MNKKYSVTGMTCAACSSGIERTVSKLDGVTSCSVSLMGESMDVTFDESKLSDGDIRAAVTSLGYGAYDYGKAPAKKQKGLTLKLRFFLSLVLLIPEMYLAMGHMIGLPVPSGWLNYGFQIGLTLAVLCINYRFFASGVMAAVKLVPNMDTLVTLGAAASFFYSLAVAISGSGGHLFFESAAMIVTLVTLGKWLEDGARRGRGRKSKSSSPSHPIPSPSYGREKRCACRLQKSGRAISSSSSRAARSRWTAPSSKVTPSSIRRRSRARACPSNSPRAAARSAPRS